MSIKLDTTISKNYSKKYSDFLVRNLGGLLLKPNQWRQQLEKARFNFSLMNLSQKERYTPTCITLSGKEIKLVDSLSFLWTYVEIFENEIYKFKASSSSPTIIDCGANIGLSILYFKQLYPNSRIIAFEPDLEIFEILKNNVQSFKSTNVELIRKAVWSSETFLEFMAEGADAGRVVQIESPKKSYQVPTARLRHYLNEPIDLLKIDVEGAEIEILKDCSDLLSNVKNLFVEYHSFANSSQSLDILIKILSEAGFRLHIHPTYISPNPLMERNINTGMDMLLNIFAFREP